MKKILSTLLVASMLLSMIPAFAVSAADEESEPDVFDNAATEGYVEDDDGFATIDDELEFVEFARVANENGWGYMQTETIKITKDLDMSKLPEGVTYSPIQDGLFILDFGGNTVSNLHVTVTDVDSGNYGIIANQLTNAYPDFSAGIINLNLVDSSLTVDVVDGSAVNVGGLIGNANRAFVDNVNLTNVSITTDACDNVGGLVGNKSWSNCSNVSTNEA